MAEEVNPLDAAFAAIEAEVSAEEEGEPAEPSTEDTPRDDEQDDAAESGKPEVGEPEESEAEQEPAEEPDDTDQPATEEEPEEPTPVTYKADGQTWTIEGSKVSEDGSWTIPSTQVPQVQNLLSSGKHLQGNWQTQLEANKRAVETANSERDAASERAKALTDRFEELLKLPEDQFYEKVQQFREELPKIMLDAEKAAIEAQSKTDKQRLEEYEAKEALKQLEPVWANGLESEMEKLAAQERFESLAREDLQSIFTHLWNSRFQNKMFVHHENQWYVNTPEVERAMEYAVKFRRGQQEKQKATSEAKKKNESETGKKKQEPPTTVPAKTGPSPTGEVVTVNTEKYEKLEPGKRARSWEDDFDEMVIK